MMTKKSLLSLLVAATLTGTVAFSYVYADDSTDSTQVESTDDVQKFDDPQRLEDTLIGWQEERKTIAEQDLQDAEDALAANEDPDKEEDLQKAVDAAQEELDAIAKSIEDLPGLVEQLTEEQLFALNRSLNNATNNGLIVDLNSEYMEMLIDGEYNKQQINALTKALEEEAKFNKLSDKFADKYELTGKEHFQDKADMMSAKGERQKDKFMAKIDKFDRSGLETDHKDKAKKAARDSAKSAARGASKNSARKEAKRAAKNEAKKVAKENARKNAKGNNGKKPS